MKTGSLMFSVTELFKLNFEILRFFTILERKLFKVSAVSDSREQRFYCFPKFLIIYNNFSHPNFGNFLLFSFFQERHTFISLIYIKLAGFFWVFFFFFRKKWFLRLGLFNYSLESSFVIKRISLALTNLFLIGAKLFNVSMLILQNLLKPSLLLTYI